MKGTPQEVTRRGKPAVVVLSASEYQRLRAQALSERGSFADHLLSFPGDEVPRIGARSRDADF